MAATCCRSAPPSCRQPQASSTKQSPAPALPDAFPAPPPAREAAARPGGGAAGAGARLAAAPGAGALVAAFEGPGPDAGAALSLQSSSSSRVMQCARRLIGAAVRGAAAAAEVPGASASLFVRCLPVAPGAPHSSHADVLHSFRNVQAAHCQPCDPPPLTVAAGADVEGAAGLGAAHSSQAAPDSFRNVQDGHAHASMASARLEQR